MTDETPPETIENQPQKSKTGKKNIKKRSQNRSDSAKTTKNDVKRLENTTETQFTLPVEPDEWVIQPALYDETGNEIQPETFVFKSNGFNIITLPVTETNFRELLNTLHIRLNEADYTPDHWVVKEPLNADLNPNPIMSLSKNGRVLAATQLDQSTLKQMVKALDRYIIKPPTAPKTIQKWWLKHKVARVFASLGILPIILIILYALSWSLQH